MCYIFSILQNNFINDMNDSIASFHISNHNIRSSSIVIDFNATSRSFYEINSFSSNSFNGTSSDSSGRYFSSDNMSQDNCLLLFISQGCQNCRINFGESFIRRGEDSQSFGIFQSVYQTQITDD